MPLHVKRDPQHPAAVDWAAVRRPHERRRLEGAVELRVCEQCPTECEPRYGVVYLQDPHCRGGEARRWCSWKCFSESVSACSGSHARTALLAAVFSHLLWGMEDDDDEPWPDVQDLYTHLLEALASASARAAREL